MKRNFKIPKKEIEGYYREAMGYYPMKDVELNDDDGALDES